MPKLALLLLLSLPALPALPAMADEPAAPTAITAPHDHKYIALASSLGLIVGFGAGHAYAGVYSDYGFVFTILDIVFLGSFALGGVTAMIELFTTGPHVGEYMMPIAGGAILATRVIEAITAGISANTQNQAPARWTLSPAVLPGERAPALGLSFGMQF